jgi:uncharacterized membrane protein YphA (DoxX/SURF4 family)
MRLRIFSLLRHPGAVFVFRVCIGGFFFIAGAAKLGQPAALFANQIKSYGILPEGWELSVAYILPWVELFSGSFLLVGFLSRWAVALIGVQLVVFTAAISISILTGQDLKDCSCLPGVTETPGQALVRDLIMIIWLYVSFRGLPGSFSLDRWLGATDADMS